MSQSEERLNALEQQVAELAERIKALETGKAPESSPSEWSLPAGFEILEMMQKRQGSMYEQDNRRGAVVYAGYARIEQEEYGWQIERSVPGLLAFLQQEPEMLAQMLASLGNPLRLHLLRALIDGPKSSQQLQEILGVTSPGQLYHHLKELLASGVIAQHERSTYMLPARNAIPLLIILAAVFDIATSRKPSAS